jgi:hypothetical protein
VHLYIRGIYIEKFSLLVMLFILLYDVLSESSRIVVFVVVAAAASAASVKDEKGGHGHTSLSILHQFAT